MPVLSQAIQDYLKVTYKIRQREGTVSTSVLAQQMGVSPASATNMVKRLARLHLGTPAPYRTAGLPADVEKAALEIIRHHRLLELFLREHLGLSLDQVHDEAEELEHVLSEAVESRIAAMLGDPTADPHGDPIPTKAGALAEPEHPRLGDLRPGGGGPRPRRLWVQHRLRGFDSTGARAYTPRQEFLAGELRRTLPTLPEMEQHGHNGKGL